MSLYMVLVGALALLTAAGCVCCVLLLSELRRRRQKQKQQQQQQQAQRPPQDEGINNRREFITLIRNLERTVPLPPSQPNLPELQCHSEEIELTLPPCPTSADQDNALKLSRVTKQDISNREREKLNRFHLPDNQELEV